MRPLDIKREPEKLLEPVPEKLALVAVRPLEALREPEKELEAVP